MKKLGDVMKELGFNEEASTATKEAFVKHLIYAATGTRVQTPSEKALILENPGTVKVLPQLENHQMSFEFFDEVNHRKKA